MATFKYAPPPPNFLPLHLTHPPHSENAAKATAKTDGQYLYDKADPVLDALRTLGASSVSQDMGIYDGPTPSTGNTTPAGPKEDESSSSARPWIIVALSFLVALFIGGFAYVALRNKKTTVKWGDVGEAHHVADASSPNGIKTYQEFQEEMQPHELNNGGNTPTSVPVAPCGSSLGAGSNPQVLL